MYKLIQALAIVAMVAVFVSCHAVESVQDWTVPHEDVATVETEFAEWWAGLSVDAEGNVSGETLTLALPSLVGRLRAVFADDG
jgi:hypothetical protein